MPAGDDTAAVIEPKQPSDVRDARPVPDLQHPPYQPDDKGIQDPGQVFVQHITMGVTTGNETGPTQLGFRARCVIVDNFTNQFIYIVAGDTWAPPYVVGYRVILSPTPIGDADTDTTGRGVTQAVPLNGEICVLRWCEKVVPSVAIAVDVPAGVAASGTILVGRQLFTSTTGATTLITIPAGKTWVGVIGASVSTATAGGSAVAGEATAIFATAGAGVIPAAASVFGVHTLSGANVATGLVGAESSEFGSTTITVTAPAANSVTITVASTNAGTSSVVDAWASGVTN